jgi:hypothetical protein
MHLTATPPANDGSRPIPSSVYVVLKHDIDGGHLVGALTSELAADALKAALRANAAPDEAHTSDVVLVDDLDAIREVCEDAEIALPGDVVNVLAPDRPWVTLPTAQAYAAAQAVTLEDGPCRLEIPAVEQHPRPLVTIVQGSTETVIDGDGQPAVASGAAGNRTVLHLTPQQLKQDATYADSAEQPTVTVLGAPPPAELGEPAREHRPLVGS